MPVKPRAWVNNRGIEMRKPPIRSVAFAFMLFGTAVTTQCISPGAGKVKAVSDTPAATQPQGAAKKNTPEPET